MDKILRTDSGDHYTQRRPEELIAKYMNIKTSLNHYDNLPTGPKTLSLLSTLQHKTSVSLIDRLEVRFDLNFRPLSTMSIVKWLSLLLGIAQI